MTDKSKLRGHRGVRLIAGKSKCVRTGTAALLVTCLLAAFVELLKLPQEEINSNNFLRQARQTTKLLYLNRPPRTPVIINIGSNVNPIVPDIARDDPCTVAIAFEPVVPERIVPHPALHVVPAAVMGSSGAGTLAVMHVYNRKNAASSSLAAAAYNAPWNQDNNDSQIKLVPTIDFQAVLDSLADYDIQFLLTDMQGYDFAAVSSVGKGLRRIPRLQTEVYTDNTVTYQQVHNDLCRDWWPHMMAMGYVLDGLFTMEGKPIQDEGYRSPKEVAATCRAQTTAASTGTPKPGLKEVDAIWRRSDVEAGDDPIATVRYPTHEPRQPGPQLSAEQYRACQAKAQA